MSLLEHRTEGLHVVRWVRDDAVGVDASEHSASFLLSPESLQPWPVTSLAGIDEAAIAAVIAMTPEVVLLGTGVRQAMAPPAVMGAFLSRGIGLEAMTNAAAGRTFNLLAAEGRRVVAAFLLPG